MTTLSNRVRSIAPKGVKSAIYKAATGQPVEWLIKALGSSTVPHYGCRIGIDDVEPRMAASILTRLYERAEISLIHRFLPSNLDVVELGGSIGVGTCQIAKKVPGKRVITVEASPSLSEHIKRNLDRNQMNNVSIVQKAIDYTGQPTVRFEAHQSLSGHVGADGIEVPATTLSKLLADEEIEEYCLVSDVEGATIPMLVHDGAALAKCQMILIEMDKRPYGGKRWTADDIEELILSYGFRKIDRHGPVAAFVRKDHQGIL